MNYTLSLKEIILGGICLLFPLCLYLIHLKISKKESKYSFAITLITTFLLYTLEVNLSNYLSFCFLSIIVFLSYLKKKTYISICSSIVICLLYTLYFKNGLLLQITEHSLYFLTFLFLNNKKNFEKQLTSIFIFIKAFFLTSYVIFQIDFSFLNISLLFLSILSFIFLSLFSILLFLQSKKKITIGNTLTELEQDKNLKVSLFKLAHEIKNPLAVCTGYFELMEKNNERINPNYLNIIKEEIKRSLTIINDFSQLGKVQKLDKEELDLSLLFEDVKKILNPLYQENKSTIIIPEEDELYINADYNRLKQALLNILKNSLEAKSKSTLQVTIKIKKHQNNYRIQISDNGKGMTKNELSQIYDLFYTTKRNGSGIGVPYIKEIINLHGGELNYKSQQKKGTTVIITLPTS